MDAKTVREQLTEVKASLKKNEDEHEVLLSLLTAFEGWLRIHGLPTEPQAAQLSLVAPSSAPLGRTKPKGAISLRGAILQVLKEARGAELHAKEIWVRVQGLGAMTTAKAPVNIVDLSCWSLQGDGVQKVKGQSRTWRWAGDVREA
ncbi:MAG: hypothetical protein AAB289_06385 [Chloroflexota bacterium]